MSDDSNDRVPEIRRLLAGADVCDGWEAECEQEGIPFGRPAVWNVVWQGHGMSIVEFVNGNGKANAHLIAAAPTLLAWAADEIERLRADHERKTYPRPACSRTRPRCAPVR